MDRRIFLAVSGAALARAVSLYLAAQLPAGSSPGSEPTDNPLIEQIEASVPRLQTADDEYGGASGLGYVGAQVRAVLLLLREGGHTDATVRRLLIALADLAQLAGWKCVDAAQPGLAQRYFFTGLRAAHDAGYRSMEAHILADLAFQSALLGDVNDGVAVGEAANRVAQWCPATARSSVLARVGFAYAAAGEISQCEQAHLEAHERLTSRVIEQDPSWMYYLTPNHLDCQAGYALILAGRRRGAEGRPLLRKGETLLRTGAHSRHLDELSQRRALYEGAWLAIGYTASGKLDDAAAVVRSAIPRLRSVRSPRSVALLATVATDLRRRSRNPTAADLLLDLEAAIGRHSSRG